MLKEEEMRLKELEFKKEMEEFSIEKERLKQIVGSIGGKRSTKKETVINLIFLFDFPYQHHRYHYTTKNKKCETFLMFLLLKVSH